MTANNPGDNISFIANHVPPLADGTYTLEITHVLDLGAAPPDSPHQPAKVTFTKEHKFAVCGERFSLLPAEIHKVFPPANTAGDFDSILPHVVLTRRTLPWERSPLASGGDQGSSWLAVLLFDQNSAPTLKSGTLADLYPASQTSPGGTLPANVYSYGSPSGLPGGFLGYGDKADDRCTWFEIGSDEASRMLPSLNDLKWNAHARCRTHPDGSADDYAVVLGNRLPKPGNTAVAHLVSLEGLGDQLPQDDGTFAQAPNWTRLRLVSLKTWSFRVLPLQASFDDMLKGLNGGSASGNEIGDSQLRLPAGYHPPAASQGVGSLPFDSGYTVLGSAQGDQGAAWYRGPFAPSTVLLTESGSKLPVNRATQLDASVALPPGRDRSHSVAWQLGRLLALADKDFAMAQVAWKRDCRHRLNVAVSAAAASSVSRAERVKNLKYVLSNAAEIRKQLGARLTTDVGAAGELGIPQKLVDWLAKLALLNGVPFCNLVPDASMLPPESLKIFSLDPGWIGALLDGAWSLDRSSLAVNQFDAAYQPWSQLRDGSLAASFSGGRSSWPVFGLLLSSQVVSGYWPGIDFFPEGGSAARILREDRLGPNTLLLLFDKGLSSLTIQEPPEAIHSGFEMNGQGVLSKLLKVMSIDGVSYPNGASTDAVGSDASVPPIQPTSLRDGYLVPLDVLASQMQQALGVPEGKFTTAEFALQLVEGVPAVQFAFPEQVGAVK